MTENDVLAEAAGSTVRRRYLRLDQLRALALISMVLYHLMWDLVYLYDLPCAWYKGSAGYIWQQFTCWTFILLSGFCWPISRRRKLRRGLQVLGASLLVTAVTIIFVPEDRIVFGVLTLLGSAMLLLIPLDKLYRRLDPHLGLLLSALLFALTRNVPRGGLGFEGWQLLDLPQALYANLFTAYLGFPAREFFSTDYFPLLPWLLLYQCGYFFYHICRRHDLLRHLYGRPLPLLDWIGQHSLELYLLHQPLIYVTLLLIY